MNLLLDQGLPRSAVEHLNTAGFKAVHASSVGLAAADDSDILDYARQRGMVVVTLDADFHALLALGGMSGPSVIRVRVEGLRGKELAAFLQPVIQRSQRDLEAGAVVTAGQRRIGLRRLPLVRRP